MLVSVLALLVSKERTREAFVGRAAHAVFMNLIAREDPALAEAIHAGREPPPFTASSLLPAGQHDARLLRFTALEPAVTAALLQAVAKGIDKLTLGDVTFRVQGWLKEPCQHPLAARTSYEELAAPWLSGPSPAPKRVTLQFLSPTAFHSQGKNVPLPLPALVFGGLLERWNAFAPIKFSPDFCSQVNASLVVSRFHLRSHMVPLAGGRQVGFTGTCEYTALTEDPYFLALVNILADFALYAGVGIKTAMGMGQTRRLPEEGPEPR